MDEEERRDLITIIGIVAVSVVMTTLIWRAPEPVENEIVLTAIGSIVSLAGAGWYAARRANGRYNSNYDE